jgi:hypothetical protein
MEIISTDWRLLLDSILMIFFGDRFGIFNIQMDSKKMKESENGVFELI